MSTCHSNNRSITRRIVSEIKLKWYKQFSARTSTSTNFCNKKKKRIRNIRDWGKLSKLSKILIMWSSSNRENWKRGRINLNKNVRRNIKYIMRMLKYSLRRNYKYLNWLKKFSRSNIRIKWSVLIKITIAVGEIFRLVRKLKDCWIKRSTNVKILWRTLTHGAKKV